MSAIAAALADVLPAGRVEVDSDVLAAHSGDHASWLVPGGPAALVRALSTSEVQAVLRVADAEKVPVVPRGAGTGLSGGATAIDGCVVLDVSAMRTIVDIDPVERQATVQPGLLNGDLNRSVAEHGLWYPPDPASRDICTIGGNIATNAGGLCCVKYGVTRDWVTSLEVVLAGGKVVTTRATTRKDVAGYDLTGLLVGSEGTLGVVTQATVRLRPPPGEAATLVAMFSSMRDAGQATAGIMSGATPSLLEIIDGATLRAIDDVRRMDLDRDAAALVVMQSDAGMLDERRAEVQAAERTCLDAGATFTYASDDPAEADALLEARRMAHYALEVLGATLLDDVCIPLRSLADYCLEVEHIADRHGVAIHNFGHAGDGNLHPTIVFPHGDDDARRRAIKAFDELLTAARERGGTVTGEHGVGLLKRAAAAEQLGEDRLSLHRAVKSAFDPNNILNPGKIFEVAP